jgi:hypothetical protein
VNEAEVTREHPILFSAPMVNAILSDTHPKTVTRRIVKPQPVYEADPTWCGGGVLRSPKISLAIDCARKGHFTAGDVAKFGGRFGQRGDRLWVRETWSIANGNGHRVTYRADLGTSRWPASVEVPGENEKVWKPSIHMKRRHSRIDLEVTNVRVERLHEITEEDAQAEGVFFDGTWWRAGTHPVKGTLQCWPTARRGFERLWKQINGEDSWNANPYVWRIEFRRVDAHDTHANVPTVDHGTVANAGGAP